MNIFQGTPDTTGIKFADFKQSGVSLRSQRVGGATQLWVSCYFCHIYHCFL